MNTSPEATLSSRWITYAKALAFLLPALGAWSFSAVFLFPKLQQMWADTGFGEPAFLGAFRCANFLLAHAGWIAGAIVLVLGWLEWRGGLWLRLRSGFLAAGAWFVNAAVLALLTGMLLSALIAAG